MISELIKSKRLKFLAVFLFFNLLLVPVGFSLMDSRDYQKAIQLFQEEQYDEAIEVLQNILKKDPSQAAIYNLFGLIYFRQNKSLSSAVGSFEQAIRMDPNYADAYFNLATVYASAYQEPEQAAKFFRKTLEADPHYVKAYFGLGWFTLTSQEDPVAAAEYFKKAIEYFPEMYEAYYGLGLSYIQMGKTEMVLVPISKLREGGRENLASTLERIMRGSVQADTYTETTGAMTSESLASQPPEPSSDFNLLENERGKQNAFSLDDSQF